MMSRGERSHLKDDSLVEAGGADLVVVGLEELVVVGVGVGEALPHARARSLERTP